MPIAVHEMAKNYRKTIPMSRSRKTILAIIILVSLSVLKPCHGQRLLPAAPPPPPFSSDNNKSSSSPTLSAITTTAPTTTSTTLWVTPMWTSTFHPLAFYDSVQDAIDAVPENNTNPVTIQILAGTYREKVSVPAAKPFITLHGAGRDITVITYSDTSNSTGSTLKSATFTVLAANFIARNLTFQNSAPYAKAGESGAQAVALEIIGDMAAFYGCGFVSSQDTVCDEQGRHYFRDCYIEGNIDIIWGNGQSLYEGCEIRSTAENGTGCITAQSRTSGDQSTGFVFVGGSITGTGYNFLGRAYGSYSRVVFIDTYMDGIIDPNGWSDWPTAEIPANSTRNYYYGEHNNTGPGADQTYRVRWMENLTDAQAAALANISFIDGALWLTSET